MKNVMKLVKTYWNKVIKRKILILDATEAHINVQVHKLNDEAEYIHSAMGISDERSDEIAKMCRKGIIDHKCVINVLQDVSKHLTHPNELVFATWVTRNAMDKGKSPIHDFMEIIMSRKKRSED